MSKLTLSDIESSRVNGFMPFASSNLKFVELSEAEEERVLLASLDDDEELEAGEAETYTLLLEDADYENVAKAFAFEGRKFSIVSYYDDERGLNLARAFEEI